MDETVDLSREDAVVGADLAVWLIEDQLPPPVRTEGLQSGETTTFPHGEPVGEVQTEEVDDDIFRAIGTRSASPRASLWGPLPGHESSRTGIT